MAESCYRCLQAGHQCTATERDDENRLLCPWCSDGEVCPVMEKMRRKAALEQPVQPSAERHCKYKGCETVLVPGNKSGYCTRHAAEQLGRPSGWKGNNQRPRRSASIDPRDPNSTTIKENTMSPRNCAGCGEVLHGLTKGDLCKSCRTARKDSSDAPPEKPRASKPKRSTKNARKAAKPKPNGVALSDTVQIAINADALDRFWNGLSLQEKADLFVTQMVAL